MLRKLVCLSLALLYLFTVSCTTPKDVRPDKVRPATDHIVALVLVSGEVIEFNEKGGRLDEVTEVILGRKADGTVVTVPLAEVASVTVERTSTTAVVISIVMVALFVAIFIAATSDDDDDPPPSSSSSSCPYVYAFDGSRYVLDAEPLSGAISKGLERNDLCRLDHAAITNGRYEIMVRNELEETQYLDAMALRVVAHPHGSQVYTDLSGTLRVVTDPVAPTTARDERGIDLRTVLARPDHIPWQSIMPTDETWRDIPLRHELTFTFPRPDGATRGNLIVGAGTSLWGSIMMREMLQARGASLPAWRASVDAGGPAHEEMVRFNMREELYFLKLEVREGDRWVQRGWIPGGGPMVAEERVIPLDLSGVSGDTVTLRVQPPRGYWVFDHVAMSYHELPAPRVTDIPLERAVLRDGGDATASLAEIDGAYHEMPHVGDSMVLTFVAPDAPDDGARTVFLDTRGYYHSHIDETLPAQSALIAEILASEGAITRYSLQRYVEFTGQRAARE